MIDLKNLRENPGAYKDSAQQRGISVDIDKILKLEEDRLKLLPEVEKLRGELKLKGKPSAEELKKLQAKKQQLEKLESKLAKLSEELDLEASKVPNLLAEGTPEGGEESNRQERTWGKADKKTVVDHLAYMEKHDLVDFERGAKVAGNKFYFLKGAAVRLELAITQLVLDELQQAGFTPMLVPHMVTARVSAGTGFMPRGDERQIYSIEGEDLNLIATAEVPITGYYADEIIEPKNLPACFVGLSPAYRMEGGAYGKYNKGLYRVHHFNKLEMYVFSAPGESQQWHDKLVELEENIAQKLEIPYRIVRIAAGDLGAPAYKKFDLEYWSPVEGKYRELMSCSNCTDFQARRLNIRTRNKEGKTEFVHTLNGTAAAFSRVPIALIENHQDKDGNVKIPKALQSYYGGDQL